MAGCDAGDELDSRLALLMERYRDSVQDIEVQMRHTYNRKDAEPVRDSRILRVDVRAPPGLMQEYCKRPHSIASVIGHVRERVDTLQITSHRMRQDANARFDEIDVAIAAQSRRQKKGKQSKATEAQV